jgi:hypothetical protein
MGRISHRITAGTWIAGFPQRYIGYCCTGLTTEHAFVFAGQTAKHLYQHHVRIPAHAAAVST